ncbi:Response regulator receiver domain-containing protein [Georgenia satyanarayanai]|uniref:Response regulator receiver domain-containing protein n=1 Tax=Georgenia satyanarayanai TaxID=860221 RepID=A0A2Y9AHI9_9MICO|nr:SpoIIE family protein phosphatase [Georgenia satyanarayanai]PYF99844.1 response regulator receiver domain-containing protein [Georgenia satyanarayanai]SSA41827.1 Response regulator receiver domain-containing protein [Georgenia satyanarayanai]
MTDSEASAALHLLLVEDDDGDAVLVEELLHDAGIDTDVTRAWSLEAALDALVMPVDCILLDLGLPDASGLDALLQLRRASSAAVVVLTGLDDADRGLEAVGAGADDYLVKGTVDGEALGRAVRYAVERRRGDREKRDKEEERAHVEAVSSLAAELRPGPRLARAPVRVLLRGNDGGPLSPQLCDVVERPDGTVLAVTGTAAGSGPAAAGLAVSVRAAFRALALSELPVTEVLAVLDRLAAAHGGAVSAVVVELLPGSREAVCHLAGHHAPLLLSADAGPLAAAADRGAPLGSGAAQRPAVRTQLREPDRLLVLHTAVLDQAGRAAPEETSLATVLEAASRGTGDDAALADTVERAVRAYGPDGQVEFTLLGWAPA